ncbi:MAG: hypothetical protein JWL76_1470 [Thermoleophilia bacterium]|nr:hypothetical protein [Thermoleophilia bacterium]
MTTPWHRVVVPSVLIGLAVCTIAWAWPINAPVAWVFAGPAIALGVFGLLGLYRGARVVAATRRGEVLSYPPPRWMRGGAGAHTATWIAALLTVAAGVSFVWPVNNPYLSGECVPKLRSDGLCPVHWDQTDSGSLLGAVVKTVVLLLITAYPLLHRRWYARLVALAPLLALAFLGVLIFGPVYVPAMIAMLVACLLPDGRRDRLSRDQLGDAR